ncbi:MAG: flagellar biosynthesis protein FlhB [Candidatus Calescibacterium sp.]|nr:flagellar biosynthesis protein FlhB [Candidatus Calescibacterium sp.]MDW8132664.1 flagellar biosynthesis protein FlhB [Candidatus Calescibacterium sp.]
MADDADKTEEPTEHKLQEARKKGQVLKSQDVVMFIAMVATFATLFAYSKIMGLKIAEFTKDIYMGEFFRNAVHADNLIAFLVGVFIKALILFAIVLLPLAIVAFIAGLIGNLAQIGFLFTFEPLSPKFSKINPVDGFKRIFSKKSVIELLKNVLKIGIISYLVYLMIKSNVKLFIDFARTWDFMPFLMEFKKIIEKMVWMVIGVFVALAAFDYFVQKKFFMKDMRMSFKELKDEYKELEGDPHIKSKRRQMAQQLAMGGGIGAVKDATAVVTNPVHYAVALKYEHGQMQAPKVVAKGERYFAELIKQVADKHDIPVIENVELAQMLYSKCKVGDYIPAELYQATAEVLAFVYKMKRKKKILAR